MLMLQKNPDLRPSAEEILEIDWINKDVEDKLLLTVNEKITADSVKRKTFARRSVSPTPASKPQPTKTNLV